MSTQGKTQPSSPAYPQKKAHLQTDAYFGMSLSRIGPGLVMSRSTEGEIISLFEDDEWYLPAFSHSVSDNSYFNFLPFRTPEIAINEEKTIQINSENIETCKRLFTIKMFSNKSKTGKAIRVTTMQLLILALRHINAFASKHNIRIQEIFDSKIIFEKAISELPNSQHQSLTGLLRTLVSIDSKERNFPIDGSILLFLGKVARDARNDGQQHPVIPSRILWSKYNQYNEYINDYFKHQSAIHSLIDETSVNRFVGRCSTIRYIYRDEFALLPSNIRMGLIQGAPTFRKVIKQYNLTHLAKKYNWRSIKSTSKFLSLVQHSAKCLIHIFTLMRDDEVCNLRVDCLEPIKGWNNESLYMCGTSTKLESEKTYAKWITTDDICKPVEALQSIQKLIAPHAEPGVDTNWLLLSTSNLSYYTNPKMKKAVSKATLDKYLPEVIITEADICELEAIDPHRNWRDDKKFQIGKPWRVTSHQFRRSIAVFAGQSGLITLPSLQRLLRHITKVMSAYYMKGCSAKNYLFSDLSPKLTLELKRAKQEADAALYIRDVLKSAEQMYGFAGRRAMEMRKESIWLPGTEEQTKRQADLGMMAYEETPAGGCTSPVPCDKRAHAKMDTCITCKSFVGQESKMAETIEIMEFDLAELKPGTIEYRAELQNLEDFKAMRDRVIARG